MYRFPAESRATPRPPPKMAEVATEPSLPLPPPAKVLMFPPSVNWRMRSLPESAMNTFSAASTATPRVVLRLALRAAPPSPANPGSPKPATTDMVCVLAVISQMLLVGASAMKRLPEASNAICHGLLRLADVAGPLLPQPAAGKHGLPLPAKALMTPLVDTTRMRRSPESEI